MKKRSHGKLILTTESLRILNPGRLQAVRGGTQLVLETDPATRRPPPYTDFTCTCPIKG